MTLRAGLLGGGVVAAVVAWLPAASAVYLGVSGLGADPYFADGSLWTKATAWTTYAPQVATNWWAAATVGLSAVAATLPLLFAGALAAVVPWRKEAALHGESHFCTRKEAEKSGLRFTLKPPSDGILLGIWGTGPLSLYVSLPGWEHVGLWARTRSGKGVAAVIPNLLNWGGSIVAFSVKKDLAKTTAAHRASLGDQVSIFAPGTPDWQTHRWNLLGAVPTDGSPGGYDAAQRAMWSIIPKTNSAQPFFDNAARRVATAVAVILAETPGATCTVSAVSRAIGRPDFEAYLRGIITQAREAGRPYPATAVNAVLGWLDSLNTEGGKSVRETLMTALGLWDNEVVAAATSASDFDLSKVRTRRMATYISIEPADTDRLGPIVSAFFKSLIGANTREEFDALPEPRHPTLLMMDEFTAPDEIPIVARAGQYLASFGLRLFYVTQSKQAMEAVYGPKLAQSIALNTGAEIIFGGSEWSLCEEFSKRGGRNTVEEATESRPKWWGWLRPSRQSQSISVRRRDTILPQEIHRLDQKYLLVHRPGLPLLKLRRIEWFSDPNFRDLAGEMPHVPPLDVKVERDQGPPKEAAKEAAKQAAWSAIP